MVKEAKIQEEMTPYAVAETILHQKLADIVTVLYLPESGKSRLYEEIMAMVEKCLFRIALERNNYLKGAAANYLGINRNTFQKKLLKLGIKIPPK